MPLPNVSLGVLVSLRILIDNVFIQRGAGGMLRYRQIALRVPLAVILATTLSNCGGGSGSSGNPPPGPTLQQQIQAATDTANNTSDCTTIEPFYWEIGNGAGSLVTGQVGSPAVDPGTPLSIASASKWWWGAYLIEKKSGSLSSSEQDSLRMLTGYNSFNSLSCVFTATIQACADAGQNDVQDGTAIGKFYYTGGDDQQLAVAEGLGAYTDGALANEMETYLGSDLAIAFGSPDLAGGMKITPETEAAFLRKIVSAKLKIHDYLGANPVCTNPSTCSTALYTPVPSSESWHYSYNHWIEDDPVNGDAAFSSPGLFGTYPWIDKTKTYYGMVARYSTASQAYIQSVYCGAKIRKAFVTATPQ
jgi:hypothetical protein